MYNEDTAVPWVGPCSIRNVFTVVVLSSNIHIIERISESLSEVHSKGDFKWKLAIIRAHTLKEVTRHSDITGKIAMDFIILGIDTSKISCIDWANENLERIHPDLKSRRVLLVNASGLAVNEMAVSASELIDLYLEDNLDMISANVHLPEDCLNLARRALKYLEVTIGVRTGIPNLNI